MISEPVYCPHCNRLMVYVEGYSGPRSDDEWAGWFECENKRCGYILTMRDVEAMDDGDRT